MTDQKHTKGPWGILEEEDQIRIHQNTIVFAKIPLKYLAKAERIIECVNACQGIESPLDLRRQRDELREALTKLLNACAALPATDGRVIGLIPLFSICEKALALTKTKESV